MGYVDPDWGTKSGYLVGKAKLVSYSEGRSYLFGNQIYEIDFRYHHNYLIINIPKFQGFGYYSSFRADYHDMSFDEQKAILVINGDEAKSGRTYEIVLEVYKSSS